MEETLGFAKLDLLEGKITRTVEKFAELHSNVDDLSKENASLKAQITELTAANQRLSDDVKELQSATAQVSERAIEDEQILSKIDRMLEKFGELQI